MEAVFLRSSPLRGAMSVPGDKSISHRAAIIGALSRGTSAIRNYSPAADCASTLDVLRQLGVDISRDAEVLHIVGRADSGFEQPVGPLNAGNSGTTMRLLAGALASQPLDITITGDDSLLSRPMDRIITPLRIMGASIEDSDGEGHPPLHVQGKELSGIEYRIPVASAQVKSAVLIAGLGASGKTTLIEIVPTRDHTERMLERTCIEIKREGVIVTIEPGIPEARDLDIPGDVSSAAFLVAAALLCPGSDITIPSVGLNPTRTMFLDLLKQMGADIEVTHEEDDGWEPRGSIRARHGQLSAIKLAQEDVARSIDEVTLVALLATQAEGNTEIRGAHELRHKESDRIKQTVDSLGALGACIEETEDGMIVRGPCPLHGATVSAGRDHRIAMMLGLAGLVAEGRTTVNGWEWTDISFPGFVNVLKELGARLE